MHVALPARAAATQFDISLRLPDSLLIKVMDLVNKAEKKSDGNVDGEVSVEIVQLCHVEETSPTDQQTSAVTVRHDIKYHHHATYGQIALAEDYALACSHCPTPFRVRRPEDRGHHHHPQVSPCAQFCEVLRIYKKRKILGGKYLGQTQKAAAGVRARGCKSALKWWTWGVSARTCQVYNAQVAIQS